MQHPADYLETCGSSSRVQLASSAHTMAPLAERGRCFMLGFLDAQGDCYGIQGNQGQ
jgi:hypothetical protein